MRNVVLKAIIAYTAYNLENRKKALEKNYYVGCLGKVQ